MYPTLAGMLWCEKFTVSCRATSGILTIFVPDSQDGVLGCVTMFGCWGMR